MTLQRAFRVVPVTRHGMAVVSESDGERRAAKLRLSPALKSWIDNVIVPALVDEYVSEQAAPSGPVSVGIDSTLRAA